MAYDSGNTRFPVVVRAVSFTPVHSTGLGENPKKSTNKMKTSKPTCSS